MFKVCQVALIALITVNHSVGSQRGEDASKGYQRYFGTGLALRGRLLSVAELFFISMPLVTMLDTVTMTSDRFFDYASNSLGAHRFVVDAQTGDT